MCALSKINVGSPSSSQSCRFEPETSSHSLIFNPSLGISLILRRGNAISKL
jgi:hypothetical protein